MWKQIPKSQKTTRHPRTTAVRDWSTIGAKTVPIQPGRPGDQYTRPKTEYKYEIVPWEAYLDNTYTGYKSVRSSFIPYVMIDNEKYWLLGSFHDFPRDILMDFGGSCILWDPPKQYAQGRSQMRNYQHQFGCAMLELNEESKGLLVQPVLRSLGTVKPTVYRGTDERKKEYVWFVMVPLPYEAVGGIPGLFVDAPYVLQGEKLGPLDFYKESDVINPDSKYRTARNLTDFVSYLRKR